MFPSFTVSFGVVCQLITSALACWPLYNWAPGLFHCLLENVEPTNASVPLGPKDACSLLCLLVSHLVTRASIFKMPLVSMKKHRWQNYKIVPVSHSYMFWLLLKGDLFPDEGIWMWNAEVPSLSAIRSLSTGTVLGPQVEKQVNWYLRPEHVAILLVRLMPQLDRLARVIDNFATSVCPGFAYLWFFFHSKANDFPLEKILI
jgi:hypothetical protein